MNNSSVKSVPSVAADSARPAVAPYLRERVIKWLNSTAYLVVLACSAWMAALAWWPIARWVALPCAGLGVLAMLAFCRASKREMPPPPSSILHPPSSLPAQPESRLPAAICMDCRKVYRAGRLPPTHGVCRTCYERRMCELMNSRRMVPGRGMKTA